MKKVLINLKAEMARKEITQNKISTLLNIHYNTFSNKINGHTPFTIEEAFIIAEQFPNVDIKHLFAVEETTKAG